MDDVVERAVSEMNGVDVPVSWDDVEARIDSGPSVVPTLPVRSRRWLPAAAALVLVAAVSGGWWVNQQRTDSIDSVHSGPVADAVDAGSWRRIADAPIAARSDADAVWTGEEMIVIGGNTAPPCPPNAACARTGTELVDGAAYNPVTDTWRTITAAPVREINDAVWTGDQILVLADRDEAGRSAALFSYTPGTDTWQSLPAPPTLTVGAGLLWNGSQAISVARVDGRITAYDPTASTWQELPPDPLGCASEATLAVAEVQLYVFTKPCDDGAAPTRPEPVRVARYDPTTNAWSRLPDVELASLGEFISIGDQLVLAEPGRVDGGDTDPFPAVQNGGVLDTTTGEWSELVGAPERLRNPEASGAVAHQGAAGNWAFPGDQHAYNPTTQRWHTIQTPRPDGAYAAASVWTGTEIIEWGGATRTWSATATGSAYTPPDG